MLATFGTFVRTDGITEAGADASVFVGDPFYDSGDISSGDTGNSPDETYAFSGPANASATDPQTGTTGTAYSVASATHSPAIGGASRLIQASVSTAMSSDVSGASSETSAYARSDGFYETDATGVLDPAFQADIWLYAKSISKYVTGISAVDVVTDQKVEIDTNAGDWWVWASPARPGDHPIGPSDAKWYLSYHLPDRPDVWLMEVDGSLNEHFNFTWSYGDSNYIHIVSFYNTDGADEESDAAAGGGTAGYSWQTETNVNVYINSGGGTNPGGNTPSNPDAAPPTITDVKFSNSVPSAYNPNYDFATHVGTGDQLKTVPVGGANQISIQFSKNVNVSSSDLELIGLNRVVTTPSVAGFDAPSSLNGYTATWTLSSPLAGAQYDLRLKDSITDSDGNALDGEWTNPSSTTTSGTTTIFPSGNGVPGGDFNFVFTIMPGDATGDGQVGVGDLSIVGTNYGTSNKTWSQGDFNGDGSVTIGDLSLIGAFYNKDWRVLSILGDYDNSYSVDAGDKSLFDSYYPSDSRADIDHSGTVDSTDHDEFYALYNFGLDLVVV